MSKSKTKTAKNKSPGARVPKLRIHKQSGRCYGTFNGKPEWFGHRSDPETQARFDAHLARWLAQGRKPEQAQPLPVRALVARYLRHLEQQHDKTWHWNNGVRLTLALRPLLAFHASDMASEFSPLKLKAIRHSLIEGGKLCRSELNARVQIIRSVFKWAASEELVPAMVHHGLQAIEHLRAGEFGVREGKMRWPVAKAIGGHSTVVMTAGYSQQAEPELGRRGAAEMG